MGEFKMKVQMIARPDAECPKCKALKLFLKMGLADKYMDDIEVVFESEQPDAFETLTSKHNIQSAPALIYGEEVLLDCVPFKAEEFLRTRLGK